MNYRYYEFWLQLNKLIAQAKSQQQKEELLSAVITRLRNRQMPSLISIKHTRSVTNTIDISTFLYAEAKGRCSKLFILKGGIVCVILQSKTLKQLEGILSPYGMLRIHNSYIINPAYCIAHDSAIRKVNIYDIIRVPVSKDLNSLLPHILWNID